MKLALITEIIAPYRIPVFNSLARNPEIDLHVIFLAENDPIRRQWDVCREKIEFSYEVLPSYRLAIRNHDVLLNWGLTRALGRCSPAAIVCGGYNYAASWISQSWAQRNGVPFFAWIESNGRDLRTGSGWREFLKKKFLKSCSGFVVAGKSSFDYVTSFNTPQQIFTASNAVDSHFFASRSEHARADGDLRHRLGMPERFFLFVGRFVEEKGIFDLLDAYRLLAPELREDVALVFAGDGPCRRRLQNSARVITTGVVAFPGFVQPENLPLYYAFAEALILPTHSDAWGLVVNEAMACGLPIICSSAAGCVEDLVKDGWNGRVVPPRDPQQLAAALCEFATNERLRNAMGAHSRELIATHSPEMCANGIAAAALSTVQAFERELAHAC